jgi:hypothetical protein
MRIEMGEYLVHGILQLNDNGANVRYWPIASFCCAAEIGRYRGIADSDKPSARRIYGFTA